MLHENQTDVCRICKSSLSVSVLSDLKTGSGEVYSLKPCPKCSFVSISPLPSVDILRRYYDQDYWQRYNNNTAKLLTRLHSLRVSKIIKNIKQLAPPKARILDWGAGDGSFMRLLSAFGFNCFGIDAYRKESGDPHLFNATIDQTDFPGEFFDLITCFHVMEHLKDPLNSFQNAMRLLKIGGLMIVEVPNLDSFGFRIFKRKWQPLQIPTHLNHFTPGTLKKLFKLAGNTQIIKQEFFSHRISPSALVLSVFPSLSPRTTRKKYNGRYPLPILGLYFFLQLLAYPLAMLGCLKGHGEIVRVYLRKSGL